MNRTLVALLLLSAVALAAPVPKAEKGENKLYVTLDGRIVRMNPDGTGEEKLYDDKHAGHDCCTTADGKRAVSRDWSDKKFVVSVREEGGVSMPVAFLNSQNNVVVWSAVEGKLFTTDCAPSNPKEQWSMLIDTKAGETKKLDAPGQCRPWGFTPKGDLLYARANGFLRKGQNGGFTRYELVASPAAKFDPTVVIPAEADVTPLAVFPDGKRWLVTRLGGEGVGVYKTGDSEARFWDVEDRSPAVAAVRPDGKRVAWVYWRRTDDDTRHVFDLWTADAEGKNAKKAHTFEKEPTRLDWR